MPYVKVKDPKGTGNDNYSGFIPTILKMLSKELNFQYELHLVKDSAYGTKQPDNNWNGMMGELLRKVGILDTGVGKGGRGGEGIKKPFQRHPFSCFNVFEVSHFFG